MSKKTAKKETGKDMITVGTRSITKSKYRDELLDELSNENNSAACKQIRHKLRTKCNHKGGLRTRTWTDATGEKHHVESSNKATTKKAVAKTTKKKVSKKKTAKA